MEVIARRQEEEVYAVVHDPDAEDPVGFIADLERNVRYEDRKMSSILSKSYWYSASHTNSLIERIQELSLAQVAKEKLEEENEES